MFSHGLTSSESLSKLCFFTATSASCENDLAITGSTCCIGLYSSSLHASISITTPPYLQILCCKSVLHPKHPLVKGFTEWNVQLHWAQHYIVLFNIVTLTILESIKLLATNFPMKENFAQTLSTTSDGVLGPNTPGQATQLNNGSHMYIDSITWK